MQALSRRSGLCGALRKVAAVCHRASCLAWELLQRLSGDGGDGAERWRMGGHEHDVR
jgi:hypothetical protein